MSAASPVLPVATSPGLAALPGVRHAFFTRRGGVSTGLYASLNVGRGSRDDPAAVAENRRRAAAHFGRGEDQLLTAYQIHSARAVAVQAPWAEAPQADGVVTDRPGVVCGALSADCAPILLADPVARVVGAAHAGWRGALGGVVEATVDQMVALGAEPARIVAAVGPCIGPQSYEVGEDFHAAFAASPIDPAPFFRDGATAGKFLFDLPGYVVSRLAAAAVGEAAWIGRDTFAEEAEFFSNRRAVHGAHGDYGRLLSAIMLEG